MKIEVGKAYRRRDGSRAVATVWHDKPSWPEGGWFEMSPGPEVYGNGKLVNGSDRPADLVAEWPDEPTGPVVTETVKRVVEGTFSRVRIRHVAKSSVMLKLMGSAGGDTVVVAMDAAELRAAAAVLTEVADALDEAATCAR